MEAQWIMDREQLRQLMYDHPDWTNRAYAQAVGHCVAWVKKWKQRLRGTDHHDMTVLRSQSRARKTPPSPYHPDVIARILDLRDHPPDAVPRKLGPATIRYYLHIDGDLAARGHRLPRSTSTIWQILDANHRIVRKPQVIHIPFARPEPMDIWEIDFTDVAGAQAYHNEKTTHQVEAFGVLDRGTSILVDLQVADNYQAHTVLVAMASTLIQQGCPRQIVFDRDPRFIGSWTADGYPSAFMRFLLSLEIAIDVCPPQRPDLKPFIERYFRTLSAECVQVTQPATVAQARDHFETHRYTYNHLRPNQSPACGNRPPYQAFPELPRLAPMPQTVDPDAWLEHYHRRLYKRRVNHAGRIQIGKQGYYIQRALAGRYVICQLDAHRRVLDVSLDGQHIKTKSIRGLHNGSMPFGTYLELMIQEAEAEQRRLERTRRMRAS